MYSRKQHKASFGILISPSEQKKNRINETEMYDRYVHVKTCVYVYVHMHLHMKINIDLRCTFEISQSAYTYNYRLIYEDCLEKFPS